MTLKDSENAVVELALSDDGDNNNPTIIIDEEIATKGISTQPPPPAADGGVPLEAWKTTYYAVGRGRLTWAAERRKDVETIQVRPSPWNVVCSAYFCACTRRVGHMSICLGGPTTTTGNDMNSTSAPRRILCMVGPYWMVLMGLTIPLCSFVSVWTATTRLSQVPLVVQILWAVCTLGLFGSLLNVACRDPGIMPRQASVPSGEDTDNWRWNDQAYTYRPVKAKFDPDCNVIVEDFDHTCPWTGTAIGKKNMPWFRSFLFFLMAALIFNIALLLLL